MNKHESKYFNTARKMGDTLLLLLDEKDFESITIKDICKNAKVNRSTFYLHYSNLYDVLEEVIERLSASFYQYFPSRESDLTILQNKEIKDLFLIKEEYLIPYLNFIKENKKVYQAVKCNPTLFNATLTYDKMFQTIFSPILKRFNLDPKWHKYIMDYYINGISALILDWVADDCAIDVQEVAQFIEGLIGSYAEENR